MTIEDILEEMEELLEKAWSPPLSGRHSFVDVEKIMELCNDVRLNLPGEIRQARAIVADRGDILNGAKKEAEMIVRKAETRAQQLVSEDRITKEAQQKAAEILQNANLRAKEMRQTAIEFSDAYMKKTEEALTAAIGEVKGARQSMKKPKES